MKRIRKGIREEYKHEWMRKSKISSKAFATLIAGLLISCNQLCTVENIEVSELLAVSAQDKNIEYCQLLKAALNSDSVAVVSLSKSDASGAAGYDHGGVLVDLILKIGEEQYIDIISNFTKEEKNRVKSYLRVGFEYGSNPTVKNKTLEEIFPKLNFLLLK